MDFPSGARELFTWHNTRISGSSLILPTISTLLAAAWKSIDPSPRYDDFPLLFLFMWPIKIIAQWYFSASTATRFIKGRISFALCISTSVPRKPCIGSKTTRRAFVCMIASSNLASIIVNAWSSSSITITLEQSAPAERSRGLMVSPNPSSAVW